MKNEISLQMVLAFSDTVAEHLVQKRNYASTEEWFYKRIESCQINFNFINIIIIIISFFITPVLKYDRKN